MFVKNPNLGADPNLGDFTVMVFLIFKFEMEVIKCFIVYLLVAIDNRV